MKTITFDYYNSPFITFNYDENIWTEEQCAKYLNFFDYTPDKRFSLLYNLFKLWSVDILKCYHNKNKSVENIVEDILDWEGIPNLDGSEGITIDYLDLDIFDSDLID